MGFFMEEQHREILSITQEECAEVIQAISKIFRFGLDTEWKGETNRQHLEEEIGDLQAMIYLLACNNIISKEGIEISAENKLKKLKEWSHISLEDDK
jgi:NTP pyrophosphatase (non-canonical NTP hydrolase)